MKVFIPLSLVLFLLFNCHILTVAQKEKLWGVIVERVEPIINFERPINEMVLSGYVQYYTKIYYYKNRILLQSSYGYRNLDLTGLTEEEITAKFRDQPQGLRYFSFIYSKLGTDGWLCDSNNIKNGRIAKKDSVLEKEWIVLNDAYDASKSNTLTLISSVTSADSNITDQYQVTGKADTTMKGSVTFIFSTKHFEPFEYSLAKNMEQQKKMKIIKMVIVNDARYIPPTNTYIQRVELSYELKKINITNEDEIIDMFKFAESVLQ